MSRSSLVKAGCAIFASLAAFLAQPVYAQQPNGQAVFNESCASCHGGAPDARAPNLDALRVQAAESVLQVLTTGVMRTQAARLNPTEMRAVAEFVTGKTLTVETVDPAAGRCAVQAPM